VLWVIGSATAIGYAYQQHIPSYVWMAALPALLLEASFYIAPGFAAVRQRLIRLGRNRLPALLIASALIPYLIFSVGVGNFRGESFATVLILAATSILYYRCLPRSTAADLLYLVLVAGIVLSKVFAAHYVNPAGKPALDILGRMMWIRMGVCAIVLIRGGEPIDFGFIPRRRDWWVGGLHFLYAIPFVLPLALWTGFVHQKPVVFGVKLLVVAFGTFLGMLWVVALSEELFFRGLLQRQMQKLTGSFLGGLAFASIAFGSVHLPYRDFPNWRFALIAGVAGVFYGLAFQKAGSVRASMVTHALLATTWRIFFS